MNGARCGIYGEDVGGGLENTVSACGVMGGSHHIRQTMVVFGSLCDIKDIWEPIPLGLPTLVALPMDTWSLSLSLSLSCVYVYMCM